MKFASLKNTVCRLVIAVALWRGATLCAHTILIQPSPVEFPPLQTMFWAGFVAATNNGHTSAQQFLNTGGDVTNITWATNSPIYGQAGFTALALESNSPFFTETNQWSIPVTAVTPRHVYFRGHGNGATNGALDTVNFHSEPIHFLTADNQVVTRVCIAVFREQQFTNGLYMDECIGLLDSDLPASIEPIQMVDQEALAKKLRKNPLQWWPHFDPMLGTCQHHVVGTVNNYNFNPHDFFVGGDSGSPSFYILAGALVMAYGRTTTGWCQQMQDDCDALSRYGGLDPSKYQIQLLNLEQYADF